MKTFKLLSIIAALIFSQVSVGAVCKIVRSQDGKKLLLLKDEKTIATSSVVAIQRMRTYMYELEGKGICEDSNPAPKIGVAPNPDRITLPPGYTPAMHEKSTSQQ